MLRFEVIINNEPRIIAGFDEVRVLTAILSYRAADPEDEDNKDDDLCLSAGGLIHHGKHDYEYLDWVKRSLKIGDTIKIRVVESDEVTPPIRKERRDPDFVAKEQRRYYENLKQEYGEA
ncbi:MAG: hypothetical protein KME45_11320 [Stenomitos rutilans HA7619-LM2]|jgi:predicted RNA-binding protein with RPS1 domain|nr:hypothetical protein [Stenomitos rutilans HA7619-LM2]